MPTPPPNTDSKKALLDAFDQVLKTQHQEREERRAVVGRSTGRPAMITWALVFALSFSLAYIWLERPTWLFPASAPPESAAVQEASLRIALANAARHVEHYHHIKGRLPTTLDDTGILPIPGIVYEASGEQQWTLRGVTGTIQLTLHSSDSLRPFVGNSFDVLRRRAP